MNNAAPFLFRALPMAISSSAHAALIAALIVASPLRQDAAGAQVVVLDVAMVDEGALAAGSTDAAPAPQAAAQEPPAAAPETPPETPPAVAEQPTPPAAAPEAVAIDPPKVRPRPRPPVVAERPVPAERSRPKATPRDPAPRREATPARERIAGAGSGERRQAAAPGSGSGRAASSGGGVSGAAYAGKVRAILQARANALGIEDHEGSVGLSFVIGASGRIEGHSITRTSGSGSVDRMIRGMMASASFPAPPGGRFSGSVTIRIQ